MNQTFQNSAQVLSIGIFFTLMIHGLSNALPPALTTGLEAHGVPASVAVHVAHEPPISLIFAAFLGYNPIEQILGPGVLHHLSRANVAALTGQSFFPSLISSPFRAGLRAAFDFAVVACGLAAVASWWRGARYVASD